MINSSWRYKKALGDFGVAQSANHQPEYFHLPGCEPGRIFLCAGSGAAGNAAHARCPQGSAPLFRCGARSEAFKNL